MTMEATMKKEKGRFRRALIFCLATLCALGLALATQYHIRIVPGEPADAEENAPVSGSLRSRGLLRERSADSLGNEVSRFAAQATSGLPPYPPPHALSPTPKPTALPITPSPSATPGPAGYLPVPESIPHQLAPLANSPYADLILSLQEAFDAADSEYIASMLAEDRGGMSIISADHLDGESGELFDRVRLNALLEGLFEGGSSPSIQGYFEDASQSPACLDVLVHGMQAGLPFPTRVPMASSTPVPNTSLNPQPVQSPNPFHLPSGVAIAENYGSGLQLSLADDAASLRFCADGIGNWVLNRWVDGPYDQLLALGSGAEPAPGRIYFLIRLP